ncbi:metallophosphatase [Bacteroidia bacterium]|nr:metallophosphatase [Bacteroidia bacterium]
MAVNAYLFLRGWKVMKTTARPAKTVYCVVFAVLALSFLVAMLGRNVLLIGLQKVLYDIGTVWMGYMLYLTMYFVLTDLILWVIKGKRWKVEGAGRCAQVVSGYALVSVLLLYGNYQFNHPKIVETEVVVQKGMAGQARNDTALCGTNRQTLKIVAVSDLHLGVQIDKKRLQKYVQLINAQQPDAIFIAGDLVDNNVLPLTLEHMEEEINQLQAPLGVYFCLGNHEYMSGIDNCKEFLAKTNMTVLIDNAAMMTENIQIIGRDDIKKGNRPRKSLADIQEIAGQARNDMTTIVLDHEPYNLEEAEAAGIDLQFSGHTHDGQLFPFNLLVGNLFEVSYGHKQKGATNIFVTSGLGLWGPPFRIGTQSEIVVVRLVIV